MTAYRLVIQSVRGHFEAPEEVRLRMLLKRALRQFGFRVTDYEVLNAESTNPSEANQGSGQSRAGSKEVGSQTTEATSH